MSSQRAKTTIPTGINLASSAGFLAVGPALVLLLPLVLPQQPAWGLLLVPFTLATPTLWALIHEAIHRGLHPHRGWNDILGRALCILFGSPLGILRFGHLTHHRIYSMPKEQAPQRPRLPRALATPLYYLRILGGVYLVEAAASLLALLPGSLLSRLSRRVLGMHAAGGLDILDQIERDLLSPNTLWRLRLDGLLILALYGAGLTLYGPQAWMLIAALIGRAALVSFMDNLYHHTSERTARATYDLALPGWASRAILHANLHAVHHRRPGISWRALPGARDRARDGPPRGFVAASLHQLLEPS